MRSRSLCVFPPDVFPPRQFCCKMAVAVASNESNFDELVLVPLPPRDPGSLHLTISEVPTIFEFGDTAPPSREAAPTAIIPDVESTPLTYSAFLVALLRKNHSCAPTIAGEHLCVTKASSISRGKPQMPHVLTQ